jgi:hypothetical protein
MTIDFLIANKTKFSHIMIVINYKNTKKKYDRLCGLVVRDTGYKSRGPRNRLPALPDFLRSSWSGTGSTQPYEDNWGATWKESNGSGLENRN